MALTFFLKGMIIGFSIAIPVGPIGLLCIRRTLARGRLSGLSSGLGAATADGIYGSVAAFGLTFISHFLVSHQMTLGLIGGAFLCYLGVRIFVSVPQEKKPTREDGLLADYVSTLFLTLTNPVTILTFAAIFAASGVGSAPGRYYLPALLVLGVFSGSAIWWFVLSGLVSLFHKSIDESRLRLVNRISGTLIAGFGAIVLISMAFPAGR